NGPAGDRSCRRRHAQPVCWPFGGPLGHIAAPCLNSEPIRQASSLQALAAPYHERGSIRGDQMTHRPLILIVEDDDVTAECLEDLLAAEGYATQIMHTPRAVETVRGVQPDLVLLDLIFPDSRGEELLQALRREGDLANVPVVLLSAVPHLAE